MKHTILKKQNIGRKCFVCGKENDFGLKTDFYELDNGELLGICSFLEGHQSFPGRVHGGITAALLDETIGRAVNIKNPDVWGVTIELSTKYRKPVPLEGEVKIIGRITKETNRMFEGTGEIILENGDVAVTAVGKYIKLPIEKITDCNLEGESSEWFPNITEDDLKEIELKD